MEYSEFIEELEISLQDQMKGETAFSIRAQTMQKMEKSIRKFFIAELGRLGGFPCRQKKHMTISLKEYR